MASSSSPPPGVRDRLSDLPDSLLGHILSFLPNKEAGCASALSRRWRDIFCNVNTISFKEEEGARATDWSTFYYEAQERKSCSRVLLDDVCSALLCRRRCAGHHVALRRFHFAFDDCHRWNFVHVDQWLSYVLRHSNQELHLDLRFCIGPICPSEADSDYEYGREKGEVGSDDDNCDDSWSYVLPRRLFRCTLIRTLSIAYCRLKLPAAVNLPFLETLSITGPRHDGGRSIQRLISSCPRLVHLTLEAIRCLKRVSVLDNRLRRFALRCCHNVKSVDMDASDLMSLDYCGMVPAESLLSLHGSPGIPSCTFDFCKAQSKKDRVHSGEAEFDGFRMLMEKFSDTKYMHLHHGRLESRFFLGFPSFTSLTRLALQGPVWSCATVVAVGRVLEQTPNLEVLSLYMEEYVAVKEKEYIGEDDNGNGALDEEDEYGNGAMDEEDEYGNGAMDEEDEYGNGAMDEEDEYGNGGRDEGDEYGNGAMVKKKDAVSDDLLVAPDEFTIPDESSFSMPCLQHRVKEINIVHYDGGEAQKLMARLLLCSALVLERLCVVLVRGTFGSQLKLKKEIESWMVTDAEKIFL